MIKLKTIDEAFAMLCEKLAEVDRLFTPVFLNLHQNGHPLYQLSDYYQVSLHKDSKKPKRTVVPHGTETALRDVVLICDTLWMEYLPGYDFE